MFYASKTRWVTISFTVNQKILITQQISISANWEHLFIWHVLLWMYLLTHSLYQSLSYLPIHSLSTTFLLTHTCHHSFFTAYLAITHISN
jgi:hypothetical protein